MGAFNAGRSLLRFENLLIQRVFARPGSPDAASTSASPRKRRSSIRRAMPVRRFARMTLSLLIAYAIVLGSVLAPAFGHGFDPASALCAPGKAAPDHGADFPQSPGGHECCLALCGGLPAVLSPAAETDRVVFDASAASIPLERRAPSGIFAHTHSARAPPAR